MEKIIHQINTDNFEAGNFESASIYAVRAKVCSDFTDASEFNTDVTILVQAYNNLKKTKECIENILKYSSDVDFDLLLIDNGSTDGTLEYFKSVNYDKVRILYFTKNLGSLFPNAFIQLNWISKHLVTISNDIIVTTHWLSNLLRVSQSDDKIGMVNPVSSNVSNYQQIDLEFNTIDQMQEKSAEYNVSDPKKWHERMRMITLGAMYKKECLLAIGFPLSDIGFIHDFADDDISFRIRRAGYKTILAKDTWIHHNHDVFNGEDKDTSKYQKSLENGRRDFSNKYYGIDAWDDIGNFIDDYIRVLHTVSSEIPNILGINVKCGTPVLEIKNNIRSFGRFNANCFAFTQDAKYFFDLQTICGEKNVVCDNIQNLSNNFKNDMFDYIVIGENINTEKNPFHIIKAAYNLLKKGGQLFFSLKNTFDIYSFLNTLGYRSIHCNEKAFNYSAYELRKTLIEKGYNVSFITAVQYNISEQSQDLVDQIREILIKTEIPDYEENIMWLVSDKFMFAIEK